MNKQNNIAYFTLLLVGLFSLFSINISAQNSVSTTTEKPTKTCSGEKFVMPSSIAVGNDAFGDFIKVASLSMDARKEAFSKLSNEQKATFIKVNMALQFVKRPNMTKEQREFVLDSISKVSADIWDKSDSEKIRRSEQLGDELVNKAFVLFLRKEAGDFVEPLNTDKNIEISLVQKYEDVLTKGSILRRTIVKEMPANDRANIWKVQLAYHLTTGKFSKVQNEFMLEMMASLSPEMFASGVNLTEEESNTLVSKILKFFTKDEAFAIFMSIGIQKYVKDIPVETNNSAPSLTCNCNWSCEGNNTCTGKNGCQSGGVCGPWNLTLCHSLCEAA